jgi:biopolymer transport protein ExbD
MMAGLRRIRRRRRQEEDPEPNLVPIMNMFLVLIPFLLLSASFFHIKAVNTSIPVQAEGGNDSTAKKNEIKLTLFLKLKPEAIEITATADTLTQPELDQLGTELPKEEYHEYPMAALAEYLKQIKTAYPASDTLILMPDESIIYDTIIKTMDVARNTKEDPYFPNVVLSGFLG